MSATMAWFLPSSHSIRNGRRVPDDLECARRGEASARLDGAGLAAP